MKAKQAFDFNIERAQNLLALYNAQKTTGADHSEIADLLRASVVLAVGAVDAYVHDKVSENLVPFIKRALKNSQNLLEPIEKVLKDTPTREYLDWLTYERPFVKVRHAIDEHLNTHSLQHPGSIDNAFILIGKKGIWSHCAKQVKRQEKEIREQLVELAKRRNQIVHEGDREKSRIKKHQRRSINSSWVKEQLDFVKELVKALEQLK